MMQQRNQKTIEEGWKKPYLSTTVNLMGNNKNDADKDKNFIVDILFI